jgi:hypothetical protein
MDQHSLRLHLPSALKSSEIRHACLAVERVVSTIDLLDTLSPTALECVRDYCEAYNKGCKGKFSAFKKAYIELVIDRLNDLCLRERRLYHGITGHDSGTEPHEAIAGNSPTRKSVDSNHNAPVAAARRATVPRCLLLGGDGGAGARDLMSREPEWRWSISTSPYPAPVPHNGAENTLEEAKAALKRRYEEMKRAGVRPFV